jgi:hypothetical protein
LYPGIRTVARIRTFVKGLRGFSQGCNARAVTNEHKVVLAAEIETVGADFGHLEPGQIAIIAVARKLVVQFWHPLAREPDYAFQRPSLTRKKLRLSSCAPAPSAGPDDAASPPRTATASAPNARASASSG